MFDKICGSNVISRVVLISRNRGNQLKWPSRSCDREKPLGSKCLGQQHVTTGDRDEGTQLPGTPGQATTIVSQSYCSRKDTLILC